MQNSLDLNLVMKVYELVQKYSFLIYNTSKIEEVKDSLITFLEDYKEICQTHQH